MIDTSNALSTHAYACKCKDCRATGATKPTIVSGKDGLCAQLLSMDLSRTLQAIETFVPESDIIELGVEAGDHVVLTTEPAPYGWLHCTMGGKSGLVPAAYLAPLDAAETGSVRSASPPAEEAEPTAAAAGADGDADVDDGIRVCVEEFVPQAGAPNELRLSQSEKVQLLDEWGDDRLPHGWVLVRSLQTELSGLVPEQYLTRPVDDAETEEQAALRQQKEKYSRLEAELERTRMELINKVRETKKEKEAEVAKAVALGEAEAEKRKEAESELASFKGESLMVLKAEMEAMEEQAATQQRQAWIAARQQAARQHAEEEYAATRTVLGRKAALEAAEQELSQAELELGRLEAARARGARRVDDLRRKVDECANELATEEAAREATERTLMLLPGLREMLAPTQAELRQCIETVSNAVTRNAEQSAHLLASLAGASASSALLRGVGGVGVRGAKVLLGPSSTNGTAASRGSPQALQLLTDESSPGDRLRGWDRLRSSLGGTLQGRLSLVERMRRKMALNSTSAPDATACGDRGGDSVPAGGEAPLGGPGGDGEDRRPIHATDLDDVDDGSGRCPSAAVVSQWSPPTAAGSRHSSQPSSRRGSTTSLRTSSPPNAGMQHALPLERATAPAADSFRRARRASCAPPGVRSANRRAPVLLLDGTQGAATATNPSKHLLAHQQPRPRAGLPRAASDAELHERQLQLGKLLLLQQSEDLQRTLRQATSRLDEGLGAPPTPQLVVDVPPPGRVKQRFDRSSAQHVRRVQAAREAAAARNQRSDSPSQKGAGASGAPCR